MEYILRVNLSNKDIKKEEVPAEFEMLGGRALTGAIVAEEVPPTCDPLGGRNKLVFAPGLLTGIPASSVHRLSVGGKSPLTGGIKESNSGGEVALKLARLGIKAVIVEGCAPLGELLLLKINAEGAELISAPELKGLWATPCANKIKEKHGEDIGVILIGPAGERRLLASAIVVSDKDGVATRFAGRGGLGAVMGAKGLKAIVVDSRGLGWVKPKSKDAFKEAVKRYTEALRNTPQTSEIYTKYGTAAMVDITNTLGAMPTRNFSTGRFEDAEKINGVALRERILARGGDPSHACSTGCIIRSSNIYPDSEGREFLRSFEYETIVLCGSNCGLGELDDIAKINRFCNEFGLDSIDLGGALGVALEAGLARFGDMEGVMRLLGEIEKGSVLGRVLGNGAAVTGRVLGVQHVPVVKGQSMPAYDPRAVKGHGVTYATSPMGADHTAGMTIREGTQHYKAEGQKEASARMQLLSALYDSLGLCLFAHVAVRNNLELLRDLVNAKFDTQLSVDDLLGMARKALATEVAFNRKAGLTRVHDRLPEYFTCEVLPSSGTVFDVDEKELDELVAQW